jgi:hypothetical protein
LHPFLKNYVGNWPVKEFLKSRFRNQRGYKAKKRREVDGNNNKGKGKAKATGMDGTDDMWDFGSDAADADTWEDGEEDEQEF